MILEGLEIAAMAAGIGVLLGGAEVLAAELEAAGKRSRRSSRHDYLRRENRLACTLGRLSEVDRDPRGTPPRTTSTGPKRRLPDAIECEGLRYLGHPDVA